MNYAVIAASIKKTIIDRNTKSMIAALLLAASGAFAQVPSYVPTNGLVGWWPFNGNANDESGNGNNGTVNGATLTIDRFGNANKSYGFDGVDDNIKVQNNNSQYLNDFTITLSFKTFNNGNNGVKCLVSKENWNNNDWDGEWWLYLNHLETNKIDLYIIEQINQTGVLWPTDEVDGYWHFLCATRNGSTGTVSIMIDGGNPITNSGPAGILTDPSDLYFGGGIYPFNGSLDDIGIWNRALTQQEITALYNSQSCNSSSNTIIADGPTTFCAGNFVNLSSDVLGGTYQWKKNGANISTNATSRTYKATATGSYTCVATCNGTTLTSNAIAVTSKTNASATVSASGATSFCAGDSVTLNCTNLGSNYSVQWYRTNISMENATTYSQVVKQPGTYKVVTKNLTNGCSRISGSSVVVAVNCRLANPDLIAADITESDFAAKGINEEPKGKIYIYPNPTSDNKFTVELMGLEVDGNATLEVYNAMGQVLSSEKVNITNGTLNRTIQIDEQSKGQLCLVRLIAGSEVYDSKVILK
jgi:hypothetical protein